MAGSLVIVLFLSLEQSFVYSEMQRFQGSWTMQSAALDDKEFNSAVGREIIFQGFNVRSLFPRDAVDIERMPFVVNPLRRPPVICGWCEGIYEFQQDELKICLKYHGQGVEGEAARTWKPPGDFSIKKGQGHYLFVLKRKPGQ